MRATLFDLSGSGNNIDLGTIGGTNSRAYSINNNGQIAGFASDASGFYRATLFDITGSGNNVDLGTLISGKPSWASSINDNGQIVGYAYDSSNKFRAVIFDITGAGNIIDLGSGLAFSINNFGQIVGLANNCATLFDSTGAGNNIDLNTLIDSSLGWTLYDAYCINDNGWIVGMGNKGAYLLTPVPEPASAMLFSIGLVFVRLRRKHH